MYATKWWLKVTDDCLKGVTSSKWCFVLLPQPRYKPSLDNLALCVIDFPQPLSKSLPPRYGHKLYVPRRVLRTAIDKWSGSPINLQSQQTRQWQDFCSTHLRRREVLEKYETVGHQHGIMKDEDDHPQLYRVPLEFYSKAICESLCSDVQSMKVFTSADLARFTSAVVEYGCFKNQLSLHDWVKRYQQYKFCRPYPDVSVILQLVNLVRERNLDVNDSAAREVVLWLKNTDDTGIVNLQNFQVHESISRSVSVKELDAFLDITYPGYFHEV